MRFAKDNPSQIEVNKIKIAASKKVKKKILFIYFWSSLKLSIACEARATPDKLERTRLFDLITRPINKYKSS